MFLSWINVLFGLIFASLMLHFASCSSDKNVKCASQKEINDFVMRFNEKLDYLSDQVDQMEVNGNDESNAHEIITNITQLIMDSNDEIYQNNEENFKIFENNFKRFEKFEEKLNKIEKFEENFKKIEKFQDKLNKMETILFQLKNASDDGNKDVTSRALSTCEDKVATWANATSVRLNANLDRIDFCLEKHRKASKMCDVNPCLHGGRCRLSATGSGYKCECPKFKGGMHCKDVECNEENRCLRLNDTLYVVIEAHLRWTEAKVECERLNMTLAMPKDKERTRFLVDRLYPVYMKGHFTYLWIGLKRNEENKGWFWVDGSALGEYDGGRGDFKSQSGPSFGQLDLHGAFGMWSRAGPTYIGKAICQMSLFAN